MMPKWEGISERRPPAGPIRAALSWEPVIEIAKEPGQAEPARPRILTGVKRPYAAAPWGRGLYLHSQKIRLPDHL